MQKVFRFIVLFSYSIHSQHAFATIEEAVREAIHQVILSNKFVKIFSEYKKPALVLGPETGTTIFSRDRGETLNYLPNFGPNLGVGLSLGDNFEIAVSVPVQKWIGKTSERGTTTGFHLQLHHILDRGGFDASYSDLQGFFIERQRIGSVPVASDVILTGDGRNYEKLPKLSYTSIAVGGYYLLFADSQTVLKYKPELTWEGINWAPLVATELVQSQFRNDGPMIPATEQNSFGKSANLYAGTVRSIAGQFGAVANWRHARTLWTASVAWGPNLTYASLSGASLTHNKYVGNSGNISSSLTREFFETAFAGIRGIKQIRSYSTEDFTMTETTAFLELYLGTMI